MPKVMKQSLLFLFFLLNRVSPELPPALVHLVPAYGPVEESPAVLVDQVPEREEHHLQNLKGIFRKKAFHILHTIAGHGPFEFRGL